MSIDLADLRGYHYHSGVAFAAYCDRLPNAIALVGGRYDGVGEAFAVPGRRLVSPCICWSSRALRRPSRLLAAFAHRAGATPRSRPRWQACAGRAKS